LWYDGYLTWFTPATRVLAAEKAPVLQEALRSLEQVLTARQPGEQTGAMSGLLARLALVRGDGEQAARWLEKAKARAQQAGLKEREEQVWGALDRLSLEISAKPAGH